MVSRGMVREGGFMKKILLNDTCSIDLPTLIDTRLLVQANSGGGKSWLIRRLLEQSQGKVQQIVVDLEGEFSTLREKYDYILAAKEGDTPAEPHSAAILAKRLLELNVSAIIDLYELSHQERKHFVRLFLSAMVNAPKSLWHPCLVIIDEAHIFAPQSGQSEAMEAVIDLATRGRKRGYSLILATQRLSKLHKDAVAECNNKLIGRTGLDIDRKRAAEELGFASKDDALSLRNLAPGEFYAFGPAISEAVEKVTIGPVETNHPKAGARIMTHITPPTDTIRKVIAQLADMHQETKQKVESLETLKVENAALKRRITQLEKQRQIDPQKKVTSQTLGCNHDKILRDIQSIISKAFESTPQTADVPSNPPSVDNRSITGGALRMLHILTSHYPMAFTRAQLALMANMSPKSGTFGTYLSLLRSQRLIEIGAEVSITEEGRAYIGAEKLVPQTQEEILGMWRNNLKGGTRKMFDVLVHIYPQQIDRVKLGRLTEMSSTSGTFSTYLSLLRRTGLAEVQGVFVKAHPDLFVCSRYQKVNGSL